MISNGASVNQASKDDDTPLYIASEKGHLEIVKVLIASEASVNQANKDFITPLLAASHSDHMEIVKVLLTNHANCHYNNNSDITPIDVGLRLGLARSDIKLFCLKIFFGIVVDH